MRKQHRAFSIAVIFVALPFWLLQDRVAVGVMPKAAASSQNGIGTSEEPDEGLLGKALGSVFPSVRTKSLDPEKREGNPHSDESTNASVELEASFKQALCEYRQLKTTFPSGPGSLYYASIARGSDMFPAHENDWLTVMVRSDSCPEGLHSYVNAERAKGGWRITREVDCRNTNHTELYRTFRMMKSAEPAEKNKGGDEFNFAILGVGDFLVRCEDGFVATRMGRYRREADGTFRDPQGCVLMRKDLRPARADDLQNEQFAVVDIMSDEVKGGELISSGRLAIDFDADRVPLLQGLRAEVAEGFLEREDPGDDTLGFPQGFFREADPNGLNCEE